MIFVDPSGARLLGYVKLNEATGLISGNGDYLALAASHPLAIGGVLFRHLVNGLDQRYATPYPKRLDTGQRRPWRLAGFLLIFSALLRLGWPAARRSLGPARWRYLVVLALACVTSLTAAIEQRFLLPLFAVALLLALAPGWPPLLGPRDPAVGWRRFAVPAAIAVAGAAFMAVMWMVAAATSAHLTLA
jgi:lysylphosphatidylglycerol synthetase-like protein (DUF2156 family)